MEIAVILLLVIILVLTTILARKKKEKIDLHELKIQEQKKIQREGPIMLSPLQHIVGIPNVKEGEEVSINVYDDKITINDIQTIPFNRVVKTLITEDSKLEIIEKQKSVIKRAVVGGLILGPAAAIVGGLSGLGTERIESRKTVYFLTLNYVNKQGENTQAIFTLINDDFEYLNKADMLAERVNKVTGYKEEKEKEEVIKVPYEI
ncbi:hypothetical protein [Paenibacillus oleatilyticus]|uniref:hypothetical protein n=1 Tax=Paenibacillus oleatilyticus TaxID=2594886 RepID=UPI001C20089F|nr:hypothetical protein [Paenibacillus oleatilyticus]MBU7316174.1 hypothetical protein [Paenibacillus oleatilyticus]